MNPKANIHKPSGTRNRDPSNQAAKTDTLDRTTTGTCSSKYIKKEKYTAYSFIKNNASSLYIL
jgi:hypothetical protein